MSDAVWKREVGGRSRSYSSEQSALKYSVGQCLIHRQYSYRGVIVEHDSKCTQSPAWMALMRIHQLERGAKQPFYSVLPHVDDRTGLSYIAEDNIVVATHVQIKNPQLGQHFTHYDKKQGRYIPNFGLRSIYTKDVTCKQENVSRPYPGFSLSPKLFEKEKR
mmetsp:Transcript_43380/g.60903  ORF Transcript_43380/g.60903 Transcript_43380/m.60903 type:complete len:162 (+) Transcript_43380:126-611(+)